MAVLKTKREAETIFKNLNIDEDYQNALKSAANNLYIGAFVYVRRIFSEVIKRHAEKHKIAFPKNLQDFNLKLKADFLLTHSVNARNQRHLSETGSTVANYLDDANKAIHSNPRRVKDGFFKEKLNYVMPAIIPLVLSINN